MPSAYTSDAGVFFAFLPFFKSSGAIQAAFSASASSSFSALSHTAPGAKKAAGATRIPRRGGPVQPKTRSKMAVSKKFLSVLSPFPNDSLTGPPPPAPEARRAATRLRSRAPLCAAWIFVAAAASAASPPASGSIPGSGGFAGSGVTWFANAAGLANQRLASALAFWMFRLVSWNPKSPIFAAPFSSRWMLSKLKSP